MEAEKYTKGGKNRITYNKRPIIDLAQPRRTYIRSRGKAHATRIIREYIDWNGERTFERKPMKITRITHSIAQMRNYVHAERKRRSALRAKQGLCGKTNYIIGKWRIRQLEATSQKLQEAAGNNDMHPIWKYQSRLRMTSTNNHIAIKKKDGTERQGLGETLTRWEEWAEECFSKEQKNLTPKIEHIREQEWEKPFTRTAENLQEIRERPQLTQLIKKQPEIETWLNQDYAEQDIDIELRNLSLSKSHGNDGIPGEACTATREWAVKPMTKITNLIKGGQPIPERWAEGTIVYIYKDKGSAGACGNYRPICLTRIVYKIRSGLITRNMKNPAHRKKQQPIRI